ncbi:MAG: UDP-3-O-[3-hydroxymyristoyl] N-acetylglucosamine deacetylase [Planctomycetes bacterium]|nr:UDP-3-O-[3-hydroxymyristoyl] N-acetylglucosamine deacetylase [Planctomycetota bacterium]
MQCTIKKPVFCEGIGLFTGQKVKLCFQPAKVNDGITFIANGARISASISNVLTQYRRNAIGKDGIIIETIEHLMAALNGLGITNIDIEIYSDSQSATYEIPNTDGSAKLFVDLLLKAGIEEQRAPRRVLRINAPVNYRDGECSIIALPAADDSLTVDYTFSHSAVIIGNQHLSVELVQDNFISEIAPARTFCMADEVASLQAQGIGKSANYQNVLVVDNDKIVQNTLRFKDEFVRHKILDLIGDLYLLNASLFAKIAAVKTGHRQNVEFVRKLVGLL